MGEICEGVRKYEKDEKKFWNKRLKDREKKNKEEKKTELRWADWRF